MKKKVCANESLQTLENEGAQIAVTLGRCLLLLLAQSLLFSFEVFQVSPARVHPTLLQYI